MGFVAVPNVSEGRNARLIARLVAAVTPGRLLDVHSDLDHNRTVLTIADTDQHLVDALSSLAVAALDIDLTEHEGAHPRLGALDVCPIVAIDPSEENLARAARLADNVATAIAEAAGLPVYLYGAAARRPETRSLPGLRAGGLARLRHRARSGLLPDHGPREIDTRHGVVCVGARGPLIAFNVMIDAGIEIAEQIASRVRTRNGGPPGIRGLGMWLPSRALAQISMNLVDPDRTGIEAAFDVVSREAHRLGAQVVATEIVGLLPSRYMPAPESEAARLLIEPGRSLEEAENA